MTSSGGSDPRWELIRAALERHGEYVPALAALNTLKRDVEAKEKSDG